MSVAKRLIVNFLHLFSGSVIGQLLFLAGLVRVAREVGPAAFGLWNLALVWMLFLFRIGEMGLDIVGIRSIASAPSDLSKTVWSVVVVRVVIAASLVLCVLLCAAMGWAPQDAGELLVIFSMSLIPLAVTLEWVFEGIQSVRIVSVARIMKGASFAILVWLFFGAGNSRINNAAIYFVVSLSLEALIVLVASIVRFDLLSPAFEWKRARYMLRQAFPIGMAGILSQYSFFIGTIVIGYLLSQSELGYYSAAHRPVVFVWVYGIVTSSRVLLPQLSRLFEKSVVEYGDFVRAVWRILVLSALPVGVIIIICAHQIIALLFGPQYQASVPIFQILSGALVIAIFRSVLEISFVATNRQQYYFVGMTGVAVLYTVFTYLGIKFLGIEGAAWAAVVTESCYAAYLFIFSSQIRDSKIAWTIVRSLAAAGGMAFVLLQLQVTSISLSASFGLALYCLLLLIMKETTIREIRSHLGKVLSWSS